MTVVQGVGKERAMENATQATARPVERGVFSWMEILVMAGLVLLTTALR